MNNIERIFEAVCNILSVYVSFKVTDVFLEKKRKLPRMANIVYVLVWLINTVVAFGFRNAMGTTVSMVLLLWAAEGILYEGRRADSLCGAGYAQRLEMAVRISGKIGRASCRERV